MWWWSAGFSSLWTGMRLTSLLSREKWPLPLRVAVRGGWWWPLPAGALFLGDRSCPGWLRRSPAGITCHSAQVWLSIAAHAQQLQGD